MLGFGAWAIIFIAAMARGSVFSGSVSASQRSTTEDEACTKEPGSCVTRSGADRKSGVIKLDSIDSNSTEVHSRCLGKCRRHKGATGCEMIWDQRDSGCYVHTHGIDRGNNDTNHFCWVFSKCAGSSVTAKCSSTNVTAVVDETVMGSVVNLTVEGCDNYTVTNNTMVHASLADCASTLKEGNDTITQALVLVATIGRSDRTNTIIRTTRYEIEIQCRFNRRLGISSSHTTNVGSRRANFVKEAKTNYTAMMVFYTSKNFLTPATSPLQVDSFEPMYILITGLHNNGLFTFVTEQCFATPTPDPYSSTRYLFFDEQCPIDDTFEQVVSRNGEYGFTIRAFTFIR